VEAGPTDLERLATLVTTELEVKQLDRARKHLRILNRLSVADPWIFYRLGKALMDHAMEKEAEAEFDRADANKAAVTEINALPDVNLSDFYLQISQARFKHRDYEAALETLSKINPASEASNGDLKWDYSKRQANYRLIDLDSRDYRNRKVLIQFADNSGSFNAKQLGLIRTLKLPTLPALPPRSPKTKASRGGCGDTAA
jgi:hypothetical protein